MIDKLKNSVLNMTHHEFNTICDKVYTFQVKNNPVYAKWNALWPPSHTIPYPFLPIQFFKNNIIKCGNKPIVKIFESSGTTGTQASKHYIQDLIFYEQISKKIFKKNYPQFPNVHLLALLPGYHSNGTSSLVHMVNALMEQSSKTTGFYLNDFKKLNLELNKLLQSDIPVILIGVSHALLDFGNVYKPIPFANKLTIIETGGMKGKRPEMSKTALQETLKKLFATNNIQSEYGMTELQSQAYSTSNEIFELPPSMRIVITEVNDPSQILKTGKRGRINIIDLANIDSCAFIATDDLGISISDTQFKVLGRIENTDLRGCNLLYL